MFFWVLWRSLEKYKFVTFWPIPGRFMSLLSRVKQLPMCPKLIRLLISGIHSWPVQPLPGYKPWSTHVCLPVVSYTFHCKIPSLHGLPYHRPAFMWGMYLGPSHFGFVCSVLTVSVLSKQSFLLSYLISVLENPGLSNSSLGWN